MENSTKNIKFETVVFEYLNKYCRNRANFEAVYVNINKINKTWISAQNKKFVNEVLGNVLKTARAKMFWLPDDELLIINDKSLHDETNSSLVKILFAVDAQKFGDTAALQANGMLTHFDLAKEEVDFSKKLLASCQAEVKKHPDVRELAKASFFNTSNRSFKKELTTDLLAKVQKIISVADFSSFIRRQAICAIIGKSAPQRVFEEVFVSIPDLRDALLPDVDVTANPWLFLALTETLDKRVLEIISRHDDGALIGNFSININVSTILSDDFLRFDDTINGSMRQSIILELQLADIFSDIRSFILAKTFAKSRGYKICIDGIMVDKLKYINRSNLDCDLMKIVWHPSFVDIIKEDVHFMDYMNKADRAKIILCRIDDANAIEIGNSLGINLYQGRYVQRLLNASGQKR